MRKLTAIIVALVASLAVAGIAYAIDVNQTMDIKTTGSKGTKKKPKKQKLDVNLTLHAKDATKDGTFGTTNVVLYLDKYLTFQYAKFPKCSETVVATSEASCPSGSKVGGGSADAVAAGGRIQVHPTINAYNGGGGNLYLKLNAGAGDQIDTSGVIPAKIKNASGLYGKKLVVALPTKFYQPIAGIFATLTRFQVTINKTYKKTPYVASTGCKKGKYNFKGAFTFTDNSSVTVTDTSKC